MVPVEYDEDGNILDGHHRVRACEELGVNDWPKLIRKGLSEAEKRVHARQLNIARRHLNQSQKRDLISEQLKDTPSISDRAIAGMLGVSPTTVGGVRSELISTDQIGQFEVTEGLDGKKRKKPIRTTYIDDTPEGAALHTPSRRHSDSHSAFRGFQALWTRK